MYEEQIRPAILGGAFGQQYQGECGVEAACQNACGVTRDPAPTIRVPLEIKASNSFPEALAACLQGHRITRRSWNAGGQWVFSQFPDKGSKMSQPYLFIKNAQNDLVPWAPSQGDIFACDWAVIPIQPL